MSAYRLLSKLRATDNVQVALAHGFPSQQTHPLFSDHTFISEVTSSIASQARFIWLGRRWLAQHQHNFDIFYGLQAFDFTVTPALMALDLGVPAIVKVVQHNADLAARGDWRALLGRAKRRRRKAADLSGIIAISSAIADELLGYGVPERKIVRIPNGVDTEYFHPVPDGASRSALRRQLAWPDDMTILFVGAITPRKQPHLLIAALGRLKALGLTAQLVLLGPVKDEKYSRIMLEMAETFGISHQVLWRDFAGDIRQEYQAADIFALTSRNEGMPNALLEAMASGLPSIVTSIAGTTDLVSDGIEGLHVKPEAASIADALAQYMLSHRLRHQHGTAARARTLSCFSARHILERHLRLYDRVLHGQDAAEA